MEASIALAVISVVGGGILLCAGVSGACASGGLGHGFLKSMPFAGKEKRPRELRE